MSCAPSEDSARRWVARRHAPHFYGAYELTHSRTCPSGESGTRSFSFSAAQKVTLRLLQIKLGAALAPCRIGMGETAFALA